MPKILIVDDELNIRELVKKYATFENYESDTATNGLEAIEMCKINQYDLIIMDIMMPELDGFSAVKEIKKINDIPVIMLSARSEEYDKLYGFDLGIDDYLYNTLMLTTASLATEGVFLSNFAYSFKIASLDKIGKLIPSNHPNKGYPGVRFVDIRGSMKSIELQLHAPHGLHFQLNSWNTYNYSASSKRRWVILKWFFKHL